MLWEVRDIVPCKIWQASKLIASIELAVLNASDILQVLGTNLAFKNVLDILDALLDVVLGILDALDVVLDILDVLLQRFQSCIHSRQKPIRLARASELALTCCKTIASSRTLARETSSSVTAAGLCKQKHSRADVSFRALETSVQCV
eukprot:CAMPEP_0181347070 /NCGR_PEP_ID=MMETSP1101-20121128/33680_1 /TAXON_ID=46948 /ORGANISM="Rhodomonas abbreviata, Strain Caron Lab Isolate" /LENGTH=146 /DNA_ID=CAMNT_0023459255 /DNA_START=1296 /DNA_END=1737 /DNA_ORIENTATION=+